MSLSISEQLMYSTVRLECELLGGGRSVGTAFFFALPHQEEDKHIPLIVTNKHVVKDATKGKFLLTQADEDENPLDANHIPVELDDFENRWIFHPEKDVDLCVMTFAPIYYEVEKMGKRLFYRQIDISMVKTPKELSELVAIEEITMIGYPNGIWDSLNNKPIIRRGITATHPKFDYNGKEELMIDAACYGGSSGSPVFILNEGAYTTRNSTFLGNSRVIFLGVLYAGPQVSIEGDIVVEDVPTAQRAVSYSRVMMNLGIVIKAHKLLDFERFFN